LIVLVNQCNMLFLWNENYDLCVCQPAIANI